MAGTLRQFQTSLIEADGFRKQQRENEQKAEAEREEALAKMARDFEAAVGEIVQAAVAGDFSQRVEINGKTGLVLNIGTAINSICGRVEGAG